MQTESVQVNLGERSYSILIGSGLLEQTGELCKGILPDRRCALIADEITQKLFGKQCTLSLEKGGYAPTFWKCVPGESSKSLGTLSTLYDFLNESGLERGSFLVALGGGVVGDLVGFAAATYLRGISFVSVPTTLLAQVDSSVGGKTAINLPQGKNLVGAFHQPRLVICDVNLLRTLPPRELACGLSEVVKYGIILDSDFFNWLELHAQEIISYQPQLLTSLIKRCCELKAKITNEDERENNLRAILNFGHTLGHAIEKVYGFGTFSHGQAVAVGQAIACRLSEELTGFPRKQTERVLNLLNQLYLATSVPSRNPNKTVTQLIENIQYDKKTQNSIPRFVLAKEIGQVTIGQTVSDALLKKVLPEFVHKL